jgi:nicotinate-nucleotide pyrophosphorylase (carboxylating)
MKIFDEQVISLVSNALAEDIKGSDITTDAIASKCNPQIKCEVITKEDGIVCGLTIFSLVFDMLSKNNFEIDYFAEEGEKIAKFKKIISIKAKSDVILYGERTALNFLQFLSGIATASNLAANELSGLKTKVLDTRKTLPGLRAIQKYAVNIGGANNHRFNLSSGVLIKDNHIKLAGGIKKALEMVRSYNAGFNHKIEIEVSSIEQAVEALEGRADIIMLDNMSIAEMQRAVKIIGKNAVTEASGNITIKNLRKIAEETEVDYISMGSLTNAVKPIDYSLNFV